MNKLILVRGLPGAGKSTIAKKMSGFIHVEADNYFIINGEYVFDKSKLTEAHRWCIKKTRELLKEGRNVVVANTFIKTLEMEPYFTLGFDVEIIIAKGNYQNIHDVPKLCVAKMCIEWEKFPEGKIDTSMY